MDSNDVRNQRIKRESIETKSGNNQNIKTHVSDYYRMCSMDDTIDYRTQFKFAFSDKNQQILLESTILLLNEMKFSLKLIVRPLSYSIIVKKW